MYGESLSVVVCVRNSAKLLERSLPAIVREIPGAELIIVDGNSTDGSRDVARKYTGAVISDEGKGLAFARRLGIRRATRPFVAFVGPDNIVTRGLLYSMQRALEADPQLAAVAPQTEVVEARTYWERATKYIFKYLINRPGSVDVVGTPCMYKREIVMRIEYDPRIRAAGDDTDLALRLTKSGYTLAIIDAYVREKNELNLNVFKSRWEWYGRGDAEFYAKHRDSWTLGRRLRSLSHPFRKYAIWGAWLFLLDGKIKYIPALYVAVWARYRGWLAQARELART